MLETTVVVATLGTVRVRVAAWQQDALRDAAELYLDGGFTYDEVIDARLSGGIGFSPGTLTSLLQQEIGTLRLERQRR